jgi:hypothetical protein
MKSVSERPAVEAASTRVCRSGASAGAKWIERLTREYGIYARARGPGRSRKAACGQPGLTAAGATGNSHSPAAAVSYNRLLHPTHPKQCSRRAQQGRSYVRGVQPSHEYSNSSVEQTRRAVLGWRNRAKQAQGRDQIALLVGVVAAPHAFAAALQMPLCLNLWVHRTRKGFRKIGDGPEIHRPCEIRRAEIRVKIRGPRSRPGPGPSLTVPQLWRSPRPATETPELDDYKSGASGQEIPSV